MGVYERVVAATTVYILFPCNLEGVSVNATTESTIPFYGRRTAHYITWYIKISAKNIAFAYSNYIFERLFQLRQYRDTLNLTNYY